MPPTGPRSHEGGSLEHLARGEAFEIAQRHTMPVAEAVQVVAEPMEWMGRLAGGEDANTVVADASARIALYEERYGPSTDWDESRIALAQALIALGNEHFERAGHLLAGSSNLGVVVERISDFGARAVRRGHISVEELMDMAAAVQRAFGAAGRGGEFLAHSIAGLAEHEPSLAQLATEVTGVGSAELEKKASYPDATERYPEAPWTDLGVLAESPERWPEDMNFEARVRIVALVGARLHNTTAGGKIERKNAEALKAFIAEQQAGQGGDAWDQLRFITALALYDHDGAKFGRIMARSMGDPEMMAMVVHALLERQRDRDALDVMHDIPDAKIIGKMLVLGEWQDRAACAAMVEDITVAGPKTGQKYDPQMRLGVAQGLHELYAGRVAEGDESWVDHAETMRKRVELIERQITSGYIKAPRKR